MTIFTVETFIVKAEKSGDLMPLMKRSLKYMKQNPWNELGTILLFRY